MVVLWVAAQKYEKSSVVCVQTKRSVCLLIWPISQSDLDASDVIDATPQKKRRMRDIQEERLEIEDI